MIRILKIAVCVIFVVSFSSEVQCLKCWDCDSKIDPNCGIPFDDSKMTIKDCTASAGPTERIPNFCYTQKEKVNGVSSYKRGCGVTKNLTPDMPCISQSGSTNQGERIFLQYCPCTDKDGCNNGEIF